MRRFRFHRCALVLALPMALGLGWFGFLQWNGNIHTVIAGQLYRSATLSPPAFADLLHREGIRTVINLRGPQAGVPWFDAERRIAADEGAEMISLSWSAGAELSDEMVARFYEVVEHARGPILIHCMSGSDRTGLAVALYMAKFAKAGEEAAEAHLSIRYGHLSIPFLSRAYAMDETFERLEPSLGYFGS